MIGIFGGAFDPVHLGHLALAETVNQRIDMEKIIFLPLGVPPHRNEPHATAKLRVNMLRKALEPYPDFELSTLEVEKISPSWTIETLEFFSKSMPGCTLCLMLGSDAFKQLNTWYRWEQLLDYCHIVVISRKGDYLELNNEVSDFFEENRMIEVSDMASDVRGGVLWLEADLPEISSTQVRDRILAGQSLDGYVPASVMEVIKENGIYGYQ